MCVRNSLEASGTSRFDLSLVRLPFALRVPAHGNVLILEIKGPEGAKRLICGGSQEILSLLGTEQWNVLPTDKRWLIVLCEKDGTTTVGESPRGGRRKTCYYAST
jgi:hypothetical protein